MLKFLSVTFFSLSTFISVSGASAANCEISGFQCKPKCPDARSGHEYQSLDCVCRKDSTAGTCTPSGDCLEYTNGGVPTRKNKKACECDKSDTIYVESETSDVGTLGNQGAH